MDKYEVIAPIGKGSFGSVSKVRRRSDNMVLVWKEINYGRMTDREKQQLVTEVNVLRELRNPHIVRYYDRVVEKQSSKIFIIMEFCEGGDLSRVIKKSKRDNDFMIEEVIWKVFYQLIIALYACHRKEGGRVLHRDIKPGNVFLDSNLNVKLGDFGLSRILGEESVFVVTHVGTPYYMSPEQISGEKYDEKSDIWSLGAVLYEMAALHPPFQAKSHQELARKIKDETFERIPMRYSEDLQNIISLMLNKNHAQRPNVENLMSLPQVSSRIREQQVKERSHEIKQEIKKLEERMIKAVTKREFLKKREEEILTKEKRIKEIEEDMKIKEELNKKTTEINKKKIEEAPKTEERPFDVLVREGFARARRDEYLIKKSLSRENSAEIKRSREGKVDLPMRTSDSLKRLDEIGKINSSPFRTPRAYIESPRRNLLESPRRNLLESPRRSNLDSPRAPLRDSPKLPYKDSPIRTSGKNIAYKRFKSPNTEVVVKDYQRARTNPASRNSPRVQSPVYYESPRSRKESPRLPPRVYYN